MELNAFKWVAAFLLSWTSGGAAAPMLCHFNSRAPCVFEGRHYAMGDTWLDDTCMQCTCLQPVGVGCCELVQRPVDFPAWCEVRVEPVSCKAILVLTADTRLPCVPGERMTDPSHGSLQIHNQLAGLTRRR
ncbi:prostate-associated microseminoprotein [Hippocampus zosterae]|uniref:prostate-associated microseminoprotein n=1 Tax=Hippocampus zosterae TaxID=109293 RepID=UPI00223E4DBE|nr:prostate-associated microseminoprotein [Hippocampus zosterae]